MPLARFLARGCLPQSSRVPASTFAGSLMGCLAWGSGLRLRSPPTPTPMRCKPHEGPGREARPLQVIMTWGCRGCPDQKLRCEERGEVESWSAHEASLSPVVMTQGCGSSPAGTGHGPGPTPHPKHFWCHIPVLYKKGMNTLLSSKRYKNL